MSRNLGIERLQALQSRMGFVDLAAKPVETDDLRELVDLCNYCALCSCPDIRASIIEAKTRFVERDGLALGPRLLEDVARMGKLCGLFPQLMNRMLANGRTGRLLKRVAGIHEDRRLPILPGASFDAWARRQGLMQKPAPGAANKVAYFAGCSGRYLYPEVPQALVHVLQHAGIQVYVPDQQCCGMPTLLEGDRKKTLAFMAANVERLSALVAEGFTIVCSCPTCGYMLKNALPEFAYYSQAYQDFIGGDERNMIIPNKMPAQTANTGQCGIPAQYQATFGGHHVASKTVEVAEAAGGSTRKVALRVLDKSIYGKILKDDGYFSSIDPLKRIRVAENTHDLGEYLLGLHRHGELDTRLGPNHGRKAYYPPCHLREQEIGQPYLDSQGFFGDLDIIEFPFF